MDFNNYSDEGQNEDFNIKEVLDRYLGYWHWFALAVFLCLAAAFIYLQYATPQYTASTTILVKDEKKGGLLSELSAFPDLGINSGMKNNLDNEVEILKSRTLIDRTVRELELNVSIFEKGRVNSIEKYKDAKIEVIFSNIKSGFYKDEMNLQLLKLTPNTFELIDETDSDSTFILSNKKEFRYGESIATRNATLIVIKPIVNRSSKVELNNNITNIIVTPIEKVVEGYQKRLNVDPISKTSSVVEISIVDAVSRKAEVFLDNLIQNYNQDAAADKSFISENTSKFVANRLLLITQELDGVEKEVQTFKASNKLTDIETEAKLFIEGSAEYNKKRVQIEIQLNMVASMLDFIKKSNNSDLLPTNMISTEGDATGLMDSYNQLVLERNRILKSATLENPTVITLDQQINSLKSNITESLRRLQSNLTIQKRDLRGQEGILDSKIGDIPVQERQFRVIARQQKVKEELYLYLLQKREEAAISLAATEPNARVIDVAKASEIAVYPKKSIIYFVGLLLGLLIPFSIIYIKDLLDNKIKSRLDLEGKIQIPFIGDVPTSDTPNEIMEANSRTSSAEALRIIRTNLEFMLNKVPEGIAKTIFLTSTFPKEGKTFVSVNLAATFALSEKKVLLIGMDIRNPRLDDYLSLPDRGFTNYLSSKDLNLEDLIVKQKGYENFYVLPAGAIPPNPAELLMSKKVDTFFETVKKQYDYIIVDTAPVSLVTDTLLVAKHADTFIYVARANFLEKRMLNIPVTLYKQNKLPNMCILLNDTDSTKGYGYGYGYGVKTEKIPWYKKRFNN